MKTKIKIIEQIKNDGQKEFEVRKYSNDWFSFIDPSYIVIGKYKTLNEAKDNLELEIKKYTKNESIVYETIIESKKEASIGI